MSLLLNFSLCVVVYCSGQGPIALKSLALRTLAHVLLADNYLDAIDNIKNVFYALNATDIEFSSQDIQSIIDQHAHQLSTLHEPLLLSTIKGDIGNGSRARVVFSHHDKYLQSKIEASLI